MESKNMLPSGVRLINCGSLEFVGKDVIELNSWPVLLWILGNSQSIFNLKGDYYIITPDVAYVYKT